MNLRSAIQDFTKAIELNPKNERAYYLRGRALWGVEDYDGAIQDCNKVIACVCYLFDLRTRNID